MTQGVARALRAVSFLCVAAIQGVGQCHEVLLPDIVESTTPAIVGIGTYSAIRRPPARLMGSGFVVADGTHAATNFHVVDVVLDPDSREQFVIFTGRGRDVEYRVARLAAKDEVHDLAILKFEGTSLKALKLDTTWPLREGTAVAFTGFPIGAVLGLHPVTHQGIVAAITPIAIPSHNARQLTVQKIAALRDPYEVIQLDATAYPGNSGSPVFLSDNEMVVGIINQVFVKGKKEDILKDPSAITYAIPAKYLAKLINEL